MEMNKNSPAEGNSNKEARQSVDFEKLKNKLESFKKSLIKKYPFVVSFSLLPPQAFMFFEEDEALPKEVIDSKPLHVLVIIPEEQYKNINKIKPEIVKMAKDTGENLWVHVKTPVDLWNYGLDSKFELLDASAAGFPVYDKGFLGALRVAHIHKSLVIKKFEKYVASYVIGGSLVRGTAGKDSDVDTFVIIDDTDVKRMSRIELLERLRGIVVGDFVREATALAGVKNILNIQVYLLTDFWQSVKDAHPVMFTFIRDGIPLYDRGTFLPWKLLLRMGKIKPSPEAVDMFMKSGDQTDTLVKRRMLDAMVDIYWGVITPTQALVMLAGEGPEAPKHIVEQVRRVLVDKEKLMGAKELKILEKIVKMYKDYEHGKLTEIPAKDVDILMSEFKHYIQKLKELREKLELRMQEHTAEKINDDVSKLLKQIFGDKGKDALINDLNNELIKKGKIHPRMLSIAKEVLNINAKAKKMNPSEMQRIDRDASDLMGSLIEYHQRKDLVSVEKSIIQITYSGRKADLVLTDAGTFLSETGKIRKVENGKLIDSNPKELEKAVSETKQKLKYHIPANVFDALRKELGDFELIF